MVQICSVSIVQYLLIDWWIYLKETRRCSGSSLIVSSFFLSSVSSLSNSGLGSCGDSGDASYCNILKDSKDLAFGELEARAASQHWHIGESTYLALVLVIFYGRHMRSLHSLSS